MNRVRNEVVEAYPTIDAICASIDKALEQVNGKYIPPWQIKFCCDQHSLWYEATDADGTKFSRGNLPDLVKVCKILNGWERI